MWPSPYRTAARAPNAPVLHADEEIHTGVVLFALWLGSAARVALALANGEVFTAEPTLALLTVVLLPVVARHSLNEWFARRRAA